MKLLFEDCLRINNDLYFLCRDYNILCSMNILDGEINLIDSIPEGGVRKWRIGKKIIHLNEYLYFSPMSADKIWRFSLLSREWKGYDRKEIDNWTPNKEMFAAVLFDSKIFFIGSCYPSIIVMNPESGDMDYITGPYESRGNLCKEKNDCMFRADYVIIDHYIYIASCVDNMVLKFNLINYDFEYLEIHAKGCGFSGIDWDGKYFYLSPRKNGPIVIWDGKNYIREVNTDIDKSTDEVIFGGVTCLDKDRVVFPAYFSNNTIELVIKDDIKMERIDKQYLLYKKIDEKTMISLDDAGNLEIIYEGKSYSYKSEVKDAVLGLYIKSKMIEFGESINNIEKESSLMSLNLFTYLI